MEQLAHHLAHEARRLGLESADLQAAPPETVQAFAQVVLAQLVALGMLRGETEVGCWATPRAGGH
ncbi:hypothetical protein [Deinococcus radiopugnans]|uniref:hypothetical protein n=1 Tax=Deinococcus radiopugnans TaxID=57497 RepID=UPI0009E04210|nr:hypothetical protein [Deinococcus radiopugnans]